MTLVETVVALGLLVICGISGFYAFMQLNRYAARERNISSAKALCQERIEQALTMRFQPPTSLPTVIGQDNITSYNILGTSTYYTPAGVYFGAESFAEPVTVYVQQDGSTNSAIPGVRTTTVTPAPLTDTSSTSLGMVQFAVTVAYTVNGENRTYNMYTMRGSD